MAQIAQANPMQRWLPLAGGVVLLGYYMMRVQRGHKKAEAQYAEEMRKKEAPLNDDQPRYPYVPAKDRLFAPGILQVVVDSLARPGLYGLPRRDILTDVGGTQTVTYTDHFLTN